MKILIAHNAYQQRGGEDSVVDAEIELLRSRGHSVFTYFRSNDDINAMPSWSVASQMLWSTKTTKDIDRLVSETAPDVIHAHNTFPLMSPSLYWAASRHGIPVVQTLHNFRLFCLNALFLRQGRVCEDCITHVPWRGVANRCYRDSGNQSAALAGLLVLHRQMGTWQNKITRYIALNDFCRRKFIEGGLPPERLSIKPNFVDFPVPEPRERSGFLFVGRLSMEKGISTLVDAAKSLPRAQLRIAGSGPESHLLSDVAGLSYLGSLPGDQIRQEMAGAEALILPSIWYENFPRTLVEAFGCGLPVIASRIGALAELIEDGVTGLLFEPGNPGDLATKMRWAMDHPQKIAAMGLAAREHYEKHFTAEINYRQLMAIYAEAIDSAKGTDFQ